MKCVGVFSYYFTANLLLSLPVEEFKIATQCIHVYCTLFSSMLVLCRFFPIVCISVIIFVFKCTVIVSICLTYCFRITVSVLSLLALLMN